MKVNAIKIRRNWGFNPSQRPHSSPKGKKGYDRKENRRIERNW